MHRARLQDNFIFYDAWRNLSSEILRSNEIGQTVTDDLKEIFFAENSFICRAHYFTTWFTLGSKNNSGQRIGATATTAHSTVRFSSTNPWPQSPNMKK
jgi:hypothetical protein